MPDEPILPAPQLTVADKPARTVLEELVKPLVPKRWVWVTDESPQADSDRTRVRVSQRKVERGGTGDARRHWVTFQLTITVASGDGQAAAERQLDDDLDTFLYALDGAGVPWTSADKGKFEDEGNRWGYSTEVRIYTTKRKV